jgi:predicted NUDIX family NTP pyrophosphohydrolase
MTSAGLLLYRQRAELEVLLGHMGGPFWSRKDERAWTIPKGEINPGEEPLAAALREFGEELGHAPPEGDIQALGEVQQRAGKRVIAFALEGDFDPGDIQPGTFLLEWPPRSGKQIEVPEIDRCAWLTLDEARPRIIAGQVPLLDRLRESLDM